MRRFDAVVFDWAGTVIDFGSFAPMDAFVEAFARFGVEPTLAETRAPMGSPKRAHIAAMLDGERLAAEWERANGRAPTAADVDAVYDVFVPMNEEVVARHSTLIPGAREAVERLRAAGLKIGSTTGYTRSIMARVLRAAAEQGFEPEALVCADDLPETRPGPFGMVKCLLDLRVWPPDRVVKVDDTPPGIAEGVAAGCLAVGVALSGNLAGLTIEEASALPTQERDALRARVAAQLRDAGAAHVIDTVAELPALLDRLDRED